MNTKELWTTIINKFTSEPQDVQTAPQNRTQGKWYYAYAEHGKLYVESGRNHAQISKISGRRKLNEEELEAIYSIYIERKRSKTVSHEAQKATYNSSYWYGIFRLLNL